MKMKSVRKCRPEWLLFCWVKDRVSVPETAFRLTWSMNLVCVPGLGKGVGCEDVLAFPSGDYTFVDAEESGVGAFALCSLFSPVFELADQAAAEATAAAALDALFDRRHAAAPRGECQNSAVRHSSNSVSRRDLLRGAFLRSGA